MVDDLLPLELRNINKAVENLNMAGKVAVVEFTTPSTIKQYIERGTVLQGGLFYIPERIESRRRQS